jgi:putative ABC transport system ATP-binding protein
MKKFAGENRLTTSDTAIELVDIEKVVPSPEGSLTILKGVSLQIKQGETLAITGSSGSGKSTLLGLMAGLDSPSKGSIRVLGQDIRQLDEDGRAQLRKGRIGFVFQSFQLIAHLDALENVMLPLELCHQPHPRLRAQNLLESVGLSGRLHHFPNQLSGGEQQRVAIARAFATSPELLFADEPTGNLDARSAAAISDLLFELNHQHGTTLVLVTHDPRLAARCHHRITLDEGCVSEEIFSP